jgi:hypothetical protein
VDVSHTKPGPIAHVKHEGENAEFEPAPKTPVKSGALVRHGTPIVPPVSVPKAARQAAAGSSARALTAASSMRLFRNTDLGGGTSIPTAEPSVAVHGSVVFETWNSYAAISNDGGTSFSYLNPRSLPSVYGGFCCDQIAYYEPNNDLYVWVLQYWSNTSGSNALRVVVFKGAANLLAHRYVNYWDLTPQQLGDPSGVNYDQPKVTSTLHYLYIEATRYGSVTTGGSRSVVLRLPLSALATGGYLSYGYYRLSSDPSYPNVFSPALVQGTSGTTTAYFAGHLNNATLRLSGWSETGGVSRWNVGHSAYPALLPHRCPRTGGTDWCQRPGSGGGYANDDRINSGWLVNDILGFSWNASQGSGGLGTFPYPYVHVVRINQSTKALVNQPIVWNPNFAFQYAAFTGNGQGNLGGVTLWGGGTAYEDCAVLIHDSLSSAFWDMAGADASNSDTTSSGDYLTVRSNSSYPGLFGGTCFGLRNGSASANVHPYYVLFGRTGAAAP